MITVIKALAPNAASDRPFHVTRTEMTGFREYAEGFTSDAFRQYEINDIEDEWQTVQDYQTELRMMEAELVIAYPNQWARYTTKDTTNQENEASLRDMAHQDRNQIDTAIGIRGGSNYVSGQSACWVGPTSFEEEDAVTFLVLPLTIRFDEDVS